MAAPPAVLSPAARLPVELIEMICEELAVLDLRVRNPGTTTRYMYSQQAALASAALVSRIWAGPAQTALLHSLRFDTADECADFLAAMEHNPHLLGLPRAIDFCVTGFIQDDDEAPLDMPNFIATLLEKCRNLETVHIYAERSISSLGFDFAIRNMRHLRHSVFEANPMLGETNNWFNDSIRQLPSHVRVVGAYDDAVELDIVFDLPFNLDLLEYRYMRDEPSLLFHCLDALLEAEDRPFRVSRLNVYVEPDLDLPVVLPMVSADIVKDYTASFAACGVVFQLLELAWS
ncbi:hypothetical protein JCM3775_002520 [Rhodotorula graminis]